MCHAQYCGSINRTMYVWNRLESPVLWFYRQNNVCVKPSWVTSTVVLSTEQCMSINRTMYVWNRLGSINRTMYVWNRLESPVLRFYRQNNVCVKPSWVISTVVLSTEQCMCETVLSHQYWCSIDRTMYVWNRLESPVLWLKNLVKIRVWQLTTAQSHCWVCVTSSQSVLHSSAFLPQSKVYSVQTRLVSRKVKALVTRLLPLPLSSKMDSSRT